LAKIRTVTKAELHAAAKMLRAILARIASGELTASKRMVARLEGAAIALEAQERTGRRRPDRC
jgi:hypothetical protein